MAIGNRSDGFEIPLYSLTGDILSFRQCSLQYRYYNGSSLPPSRPVQMWTGQLVHGVLEEAYKLWKDRHFSFLSEWPLSFSFERSKEYVESLPITDIYRIGRSIEQTLEASGIRARSNTAREYAFFRCWRAVNFIGPMLFPLIEVTEKSMSATRAYPVFSPPAGQTLRGDGRYELTGIADVISSNKINEELPSEAVSLLNLLGIRSSTAQYEILVDYKSMKRPSLFDQKWHDHEHQIKTYAWLRSKQPGSFQVRAGLIVYVDELYLSHDEVREIRAEQNKHETDIELFEGSSDYYKLRTWDGHSHFDFTKDYAIKRALRIVDVSPGEIDESLQFIDSTVGSIEKTVLAENQTGRIINNWTTNVADERTCVACDFRHSCPKQNIKLVVP